MERVMAKRRMKLTKKVEAEPEVLIKATSPEKRVIDEIEEVVAQELSKEDEDAAFEEFANEVAEEDDEPVVTIQERKPPQLQVVAGEKAPEDGPEGKRRERVTDTNLTSIRMLADKEAYDMVKSMLEITDIEGVVVFRRSDEYGLAIEKESRTTENYKKFQAFKAEIQKLGLARRSYRTKADMEA
jgi:hypothetical protein